MHLARARMYLSMEMEDKDVVQAARSRDACFRLMPGGQLRELDPERRAEADNLRDARIVYGVAIRRALSGIPNRIAEWDGTRVGLDHEGDVLIDDHRRNGPNVNVSLGRKEAVPC